MTDLDPAAIMAEHEGMRVDGPGTPSYCINLDHGDATPWPCEPYRLAAEVAALRDQVREAHLWAEREEVIARSSGAHWTQCTAPAGGTCTCTGVLGEVNQRRLARIAKHRAALVGEGICPMPDERARMTGHQGESPRIVTPEEARQAELAYLARRWTLPANLAHTAAVLGEQREAVLALSREWNRTDAPGHSRCSYAEAVLRIYGVTA